MSDKFFKDASGALHVIDENFLSLLPSGLTEISKTEYDALVADSQTKTDTEKLSEFKAEVQAALNASDLVALRAFKAGVAFGEDWTLYDSKLRALMSVTEWSDSLSIPLQPESYPS